MTILFNKNVLQAFLFQKTGVFNFESVCSLCETAT